MHVKGVIIVEKIFLVDLWGKLPQLIENVSDPDPGSHGLRMSVI